MSIILEALRKAEADRQADERPGLTAAPVRRTPFYTRIPIGFVVATATLFLSVGVGAWLLWPAEEPGGTPIAGDATAARSAPAPATPDPIAPQPAAASPPLAAPTGSPGPSALTAAGEAAAAPSETTAAARPAAVAETPGGGRGAQAPPQSDSPADVRLLALEARLGDPPGPAPAGRAQGGSVEVRDMLDSSAAEPAGGGAQPIKPGSVEVRDLLAEQGVEPVAPEPMPGGTARGMVSDADGGVRAASAARPASAARGSAAPPGAALPAHAAPPTPRPRPDVPPLDELVASGQLNPPDLSLDMHAYGPDAAARFVYINMRRYRIGDTTREGAVVEDITPEGVVLEMQGRRFLLGSD